MIAGFSVVFGESVLFVTHFDLSLNFRVDLEILMKKR